VDYKSLRKLTTRSKKANAVNIDFLIEGILSICSRWARPDIRRENKIDNLPKSDKPTGNKAH